MAIWLTTKGGLATVAGTLTVAAIATAVLWKGTVSGPEIQAEQPVLVTGGGNPKAVPLENSGGTQVVSTQKTAVQPAQKLAPKPAEEPAAKTVAAETIAKEKAAPEPVVEEQVSQQTAVAVGGSEATLTPVQIPAENTVSDPQAAVTEDTQTAVTEQDQAAPEQVAVVEPVAEPLAAPKAESEADPKEAPQETITAPAPDVFDNPARPVLDLVRVDAQGSAVVAGTSQPGATVRIRLGGETLQSVQADANGSFVALLDLPTSAAPRPLVLEGVNGGEAVPSAESVLVMPFANDRKAAPKLVLASAKGVSILQDGAAKEPLPEITTTPAPVVAEVQATELPAPVPVSPSVAGALPLSLDTISYDKTGDVVLAGRGQSDQFVRVYLNNKPIQTETVRSDGQWQVVLPEVKEGVHTLRVDATNAKGKVSARVESPFKRETPEVLASAALSSVTVQPGHTLWALAEGKYGSGVKYVQIFEANRDRIRDPDLIYPGQVFKLPE